MNLRDHWYAGEGLAAIKDQISELVAENVFHGMRQAVDALYPDIGFTDGELTMELFGLEDPVPNKDGVTDGIRKTIPFSEFIDSASIWMGSETMLEAAALIEKQAARLREFAKQ